MIETPRKPKASPEVEARANVNLKVTEAERWDFKEWCVHNRVSQVDAFRRAFELLRRHGMED